MSSEKQLHDALDKVRVRYPGAPKRLSLREMINDNPNKLMQFMKHQYPDVFEKGHVQFIPEYRPAKRILRKNVEQEDIVEKHESEMTGIEHEGDVQSWIGSLKNTELIKDRSLIVLVNVGRDTMLDCK